MTELQCDGCKFAEFMKTYEEKENIRKVRGISMKTCDVCSHWIRKDGYPQEYPYCDLYTICPTPDFYEFLTNLGRLGKCPCFEEGREGGKRNDII